MAAPSRLSSKARAGVLLLAFGFVLSVAGLLFAMVGLFTSRSRVVVPYVTFLGGGAGLWEAAGLVLAVLAYLAVKEGDVRRGAVMALVASVLPPVDILFLLGGILFYVSPEAKAQAGPAAGGAV